MDVGTLETALVSIHGILATFTKTPELALETNEGKALADALANVAQHYPAFQMSGVASAWLNLAVVAGFTYGTRIAAVRMRLAAERPQIVTPVAVSSPANGATPRQQQTPGFQKINIPGVGEAEVPIQ